MILQHILKLIHRLSHHLLLTRHPHHHRAHAFVHERFRVGRLQNFSDGSRQLFCQSRLERRQRAENLDQLDGHPVGRARREKLVKFRRERQISLRIVHGELGEHRHRGLHDGLILVVQTLRQSRKRRPQRLRIPQETLVQAQTRPSAQIGFMIIQQRVHVRDQGLRQFRRHDVPQTRDGERRLGGIRRRQILLQKIRN